MRIHAEYTLYGHFYLKRLFGGIGKIRFFLDQDSGMRAACLAAFQPERGQHMQPLQRGQTADRVATKNESSHKNATLH